MSLILIFKLILVATLLMFIMFVAKYDSNEDLDMQNLMDPEKVNFETIRKGFITEVYRNALAIWLPFLNKRGFIDTMLPTAPNTSFVDAIAKEMMARMQPQGAQVDTSDNLPVADQLVEE